MILQGTSDEEQNQAELPEHHADVLQEQRWVVMTHLRSELAKNKLQNNVDRLFPTQTVTDD